MLYSIQEVKQMEDKNKYYEMSEYQVVKANELIQKSRFNLSTLQQKIVLFLISKVKPTDEEFKRYEFSIYDFCQVCGIEPKGENYPAIRRAIKDISDKSMWLDLQDEDGTETLIRWIHKPSFKRNSGTITLQLDEDLKPYLLQLKKNFTQYQLLWTLQFSCKYSIRLYELIKSYMFEPELITEKVFELEALKLALNAENHKTYYNFNVRALAPAVKEISEKSNIDLSYEPIKTGKTITHIKFIFSEYPRTDTRLRQLNIERKYNLNQFKFNDF